MKIIKKVFHFLNRNDRKVVLYLILLMAVTAIIDMLGVASIVPFIAVATNPTFIETNTVLNILFKFLTSYGIETEKHFIFVLGILVFFMVLVSISLKALTIYFQARYLNLLEFSFARRLLENYLSQPYSWILSRNSSEIGKTILQEVNLIIKSGLGAILDLISSSFTTIVLIALLLWANFHIAISVSLVVGVFYGLTYLLVKKFVNRIGKERYKDDGLRYKALSEMFGSYKEVKLSNLETFFLNRFSLPSHRLAINSALSQIVIRMPRLILEVISFGSIILIMLYVMSSTGDIKSSLPLIALYAFAGLRLMPSVQQIYTSITTIRFTSYAINRIYEEIKNEKILNKVSHKNLLLNKEIVLKNISYSYPESKKMVLENINLKIEALTTVGLVGITGSGKTTTVDIILGLLKAQKGLLNVDDVEINQDNLKAWQKSIGYVPQSIYLSDDSVASNIAFGISSENIDQNKVEKVAKIANIHNFVTNELPLKYQTIIGERGVRLSGGQRQRLGIARALYENPKLLVFDEATNSLDNHTENLIMREIKKLNGKITIILIAHRINTVKECNKIFMFEKGKLIANGNYKELSENNDYFKKLINLDNFN